MQHTIFSTGSDSYLLSQIIHAGPVCEFTKKNEDSTNTHFYRITTTRGAVFSHFKNKESAIKSRGVLETKLNASGKRMFVSRGDMIDVARIISFGKVLALKNGTSEVFGFPVNVQTAKEKSSTIWLTFKSEEAGMNVRKALYATILSYYEPKGDDVAGSFNQEEASSGIQKKEEELTNVAV